MSGREARCDVLKAIKVQGIVSQRVENIQINVLDGIY
jgi:hypothetical protein